MSAQTHLGWMVGVHIRVTWYNVAMGREVVFRGEVCQLG